MDAFCFWPGFPFGAVVPIHHSGMSEAHSKHTAVSHSYAAAAHAHCICSEERNQPRGLDEKMQFMLADAIAGPAAAGARSVPQKPTHR